MNHQPSDLPEITLRCYHPSDADDLMTWASDPRVTRFRVLESLTSRDQALDYIQNTILPHPWYRAICLHGRPIGCVSFQRPPYAESQRRAWIGYNLAFEYWGRGIMTRAVKKAVAQVFQDWPDLLRVEAIADVENKASQRVLEKAGFGREGVLRKYLFLKGEARDMVMYSIVVP